MVWLPQRRCYQQIGGADEQQPGKDCDRSNAERNNQCSTAHALPRVSSLIPHCLHLLPYATLRVAYYFRCHSSERYERAKEVRADAIRPGSPR